MQPFFERRLVGAANEECWKKLLDWNGVFPDHLSAFKENCVKDK